MLLINKMEIPKNISRALSQRFVNFNRNLKYFNFLYFDFDLSGLLDLLFARASSPYF